MNTMAQVHISTLVSELSSNGAGVGETGHSTSATIPFCAITIWHTAGDVAFTAITSN